MAAAQDCTVVTFSVPACFFIIVALAQCAVVLVHGQSQEGLPECCALETLSTMKFAQRAKFIRNNAIINEEASGDVLSMRLQIQQLKKEINCLRGLVHGGTEHQENDNLNATIPGSPGSIKWEGGQGSFSPLTFDKRISERKEYEVALVAALRMDQDKEKVLKALVAEKEAVEHMVLNNPVAAMPALPQIYIHPLEMPTYRLYNGTGNPYPSEAGGFRPLHKKFLQRYKDRVSPYLSITDVASEKMGASEEFVNGRKNVARALGVGANQSHYFQLYFEIQAHPGHDPNRLHGGALRAGTLRPDPFNGLPDRRAI
ncbi:hypothetical protein Taro_041774 [Colocasia esculenta]|uniref:Uncharacterized protein n=1 Tax=Colocasia esculenta TaxID=4460 RepID=A0A843WWT2_COLES|nr:hypothetical protein [Colocasia esculenta]